MSALEKTKHRKARKMKIRQGFVSNSSSSSFIVAFPRMPKTIGDVKDMLFCDQKEFHHPYPVDGRKNFWPAKKIAKIVFEDIQKAGVKTADEILVEAVEHKMCNSWDLYDMFLRPGGRYVSHKDDRKEYDAAHKKYDKAVANRAKKEAQALINKSPKDAVYAILSYSDDDVIGCAMEHGDLFIRLPHNKISCH